MSTDAYILVTTAACNKAGVTAAVTAMVDVSRGVQDLVAKESMVSSQVTRKTLVSADQIGNAEILATRQKYARHQDRRRPCKISPGTPQLLTVI